MTISTLLVALSLASHTPTSSPANGISIIHDDVARARHEASRRQVPIYVEVWAPW